jgi:beta-lactamase superfamily II metal-dependent hydrolase
VVPLFALFLPAAALALGNGKLQIHHIDVGQGDGALLISPNGQTALFDDGVYTNCTTIKNYLQGLGITTVDYHFCSHYHADHLGCIDDLAAIGITIGTAGYDRGSSYSSASYTSYVNTLGAKRQTMAKNQVVTLDAGSANPVTIKCVDLNGAGVYSPSGSDENAKSLSLLVSYGAFQEEISGDLTGDVASGNDVESTVGPEVGDVEVYKAHHHGSRYSTNDNWLNATTPEVCIISCGNGNTYGHPTLDALTRLHNHGVKTYWTETGAGATPNPSWDRVASGTIVVQADPGASATYTISGPGFSDTYANGGGGGGPTPIHETLVATTMTMLKGSITTGDATRLAVDDAVRVSVGAGIENAKYVTDWYGSVFLNGTPTTLQAAYNGNYTVTRTQTLYAWNWTTSAWDQVATGSVGTSDVTQAWTAGAPGNYASPSREVRLRVRSNTRNSSFTCRGDYMAVTYDYLPAAMAQPTDALASAPHDVEPLEHRLPLTALEDLATSVTGDGVALDWSTRNGVDVDGFAVYRDGPDGSRVELGGETVLPPAADDLVHFRFVDTSPEAAVSTYWLGARSCAGIEGLIGPIRVDATRPTFGIGLALAASPNPSAGPVTLSFTNPRGSRIALDVFDASGRRVARVADSFVPPGPAAFRWYRRTTGGVTVAPGVYFARLERAGSAQVVKLVLAE